MSATFYLGTHMPNWLAADGLPTDLCLFVSHRRLAGRKTLPKAQVHWALDSGGFSELSLYGEWRTTPQEYVAAVRRYDEEIGELGWAAPMDWMCEPVMLAKTGLDSASSSRGSSGTDRCWAQQTRWPGPTMPAGPPRSRAARDTSTAPTA